MSHLPQHSLSRLCEQPHPSSCSGQKALGSSLTPSFHTPHPPCPQICQFCLQDTSQNLTLLTTSLLWSTSPVISQLDYCNRQLTCPPAFSFACPSPSRNPFKTQGRYITLLLTTSSSSLLWLPSDGPQGSVPCPPEPLQLPPVSSVLTSPATLASFFKRVKHTPRSGPLLCLGCSSLRRPRACTLTSFRSFLKCHLISKVFLDHPNSNNTLCPHFLSPLPALFVSQHVSPSV